MLPPSWPCCARAGRRRGRERRQRRAGQRRELGRDRLLFVRRGTSAENADEILQALSLDVIDATHAMAQTPSARCAPPPPKPGCRSAIAFDWCLRLNEACLR